MTEKTPTRAGAATAEGTRRPRGQRRDKDAQGRDVHGGAFHSYFAGIAEAHHVIRKVFRLVDEQAKRGGLDPLEHKLLIQVFGAPGAPLPVRDLAERLDVSSALASRLLKGLVERGLVHRSPGDTDRRVTRVAITPVGRELLAAVDRNVRQAVDDFQHTLTDDERDGALRIFAFYLGLPE